MGIAPTIGGGRGGAYSLNLAGAEQPTRYVGGTTSGAPATGTFAVGDFAVDQSGQVYLCVTAGSPGTWTCVSKSRAELLAAGAGVLSEPFAAETMNAATAPATQVVYGSLLGQRAGDVVTGIQIRNAVSAAGTLPTTARFGLADAAGKILVLSGNVNALANWASGPMAQPFTAPYTILADGGYLALMLVNGVWGTTQPTVGNSTFASAPFGAYSTFAPRAFQLTGQTDLPAVGQTLAITGATARGYYLATY